MAECNSAHVHISRLENANKMSFLYMHLCICGHQSSQITWTIQLDAKYFTQKIMKIFIENQSKFFVKWPQSQTIVVSIMGNNVSVQSSNGSLSFDKEENTTSDDNLIQK